MDLTRGPDMLSQALIAGTPELEGKVHYVNGRPWCDGVNHTTRCDPASDDQEQAIIAEIRDLVTYLPAGHRFRLAVEALR